MSKDAGADVEEILNELRSLPGSTLNEIEKQALISLNRKNLAMAVVRLRDQLARNLRNAWKMSIGVKGIGPFFLPESGE